MLAWDALRSLVSVALAPGLIFLGSNSPLLTRRIDLRPGATLSISAAVELFLEDVEAADPGRRWVADFVFIECLLTLVRLSDDSATWLGFALCSCVLP